MRMHTIFSSPQFKMIAGLTVTLFVTFCFAAWLCYTIYPSIFLLFRQWYNLRARDLSLQPPHWLLGHLNVVDGSQESTLMCIDVIVKRKLHMFVIWFGPLLPAVAVCQPDTIKVVLKEPKSHVIYHLLIPWIGTGLLVANGDKWFRSRKLLTPAFHYGVLKPYIQVYNECAQTLIDKWMDVILHNESVEICEPVNLATLDIILQCAFSYKNNCQDSGAKTPYVSAVLSISHIIIRRLLTPAYHIDLLFNLSSLGREFRRHCKYIHDHSEKVIKDRRKVLEERLKKGEVLKTAAGRQYFDFLDILLTSKDDDGSTLSDDEIRAEVDTFMFEGHDTTTAGISWTLYCLAKHPIHQEKCRQEIQSVLNGRSGFEWEDMKSLPYTTMCIKEAMRLYPPVPYYFRELSEDVEIEGHLVPKGTMIQICALDVHLQPDIWENPEVYDPLRFLPERSEGRDNFTYMPFSAGPRNCIGQAFALNEERVVISLILNKFSLELDKDHTVEWQLLITLRAKYGIKLKLKPF